MKRTDFILQENGLRREAIEVIASLSDEERFYISEDSVFYRPEVRIVARSCGKPVGFVSIKKYGTEHFVNIAVHSGYRRMGIAKMLWDRLMYWRWKHKIEVVRWNCDGCNTASCSTAEKLGLEEIFPEDGFDYLRFFRSVVNWSEAK